MTSDDTFNLTDAAGIEKPMNRTNQPAVERGNGPKGPGASHPGPGAGQGARSTKTDPLEKTGFASERVEPKSATPPAATESITSAVQTQIESGKAELKELKETVSSGLASGLEDAKVMVSEATEKVEDAAREMQGKLSQAARGAFATLKANPIPAAMLGLGGIGLTLLLTNPKPAPTASVSTKATKRKPGSEAKETKEAKQTSDLSEQVSTVTRRARQSIGKMATASTEMIQRSGKKAQAQAKRLGRMVEANPIPVSAGALAVGVGIGFMLPRTQREDQWLGETRDALFAKGHALAHQALDKVEAARQLVTGSPEASESA